MSALRSILLLGGIGAGVYFISKRARAGVPLVGPKLKCLPGERFTTDCTEVIELTMGVGNPIGYTNYETAYALAPGNGGMKPQDPQPRAVRGSMRLGAVEMRVRYPGGSTAEAFATDPMTSASYLEVPLNQLVANEISEDSTSLIVRSAPGPQAKIDLANDKRVDPYDTDVRAKIRAGDVMRFGLTVATAVELELGVGDWMKGSTIEVAVETFTYVEEELQEGVSEATSSPPAKPYRAVYKFLIEVT